MHRLAIALLSLAACLSLAGCSAVATSGDPDASGPLVPDDALYLTRLGLMRGHLLVASMLFEQGDLDAARTHAKHPADELYADIEPQFAARGVDGFAAELQAHADALARGDGVAESFDALSQAIAAHEDAAAASAATVAEVVARLLDEAAREYAIGVVDGQLANAHEYQDAYGFTMVAHQWAMRLERLAPLGDGERQWALGRLAERIVGLRDLWPMLMPPPVLDRDAGRIVESAATTRRLAKSLHP